MKEILFFLGELNDDDLDWLLTIGTINRIATKTIMIRQNEPIDTLYLLLQGKVSVYLTILDQVKELAILGNGAVLGEMSFLDHRLSSATVETLEESLLLSLPQQVLSRQLQLDIGFAARFYRALSLILTHRLRRTDLGLKQEDFAMDERPLDSFPFVQTRFDWLLRRVKNFAENEQFS